MLFFPSRERPLLVLASSWDAGQRLLRITAQTAKEESFIVTCRVNGATDSAVSRDVSAHILEKTSGCFYATGWPLPLRYLYKLISNNDDDTLTAVT